ncbi:MAG: sigma-70 family RNA polymerase sigma factor [Patescibacteria group bacterium]
MDSTIDAVKLMDEARKGDENAFSLLYEQYATPLYRYIYFRVRRREDVEDLLQTVFLKAYKALAKFRNRGKNPLSFFYTIARNSVIDYRRKKREIIMEDGHEITDPGPDIAQLISIRYDGTMVRDALQKLSDDQCEVLTLRYINDCSNQEIAQLMGKTEEAVRQLQSRGLKALRHGLPR